MEKPRVRTRLKELLEERGMSQKELAKLTGLREASISQAVREGKDSVNLFQLYAIMKMLNIQSFDEFFKMPEVDE